MTASNPESPPRSLPRILVVSRRSVRKNKFIDFVGEYHLDLLVQYGACPVIVPRVKNINAILDSFEPFHGVLLAEGEDISEAFRGVDPAMDDEVLSAIQEAHPSDSVPDCEKDQIEFELVKRCLKRGIPYMGICRGSQILNVVAGGKLLMDVETQVENPCKHIDYDNYDGHRHPISLSKGTPMCQWFDNADELHVNSYHHQGIQALAKQFIPMAHSPDGLIEAFYDPIMYNPDKGRFLVGLQFHPERMQDTDIALRDEQPRFDYPGCPKPYEAFVRASTVFCHRQEALARVECIPQVSPTQNRVSQLFPTIPIRNSTKSVLTVIPNTELETVLEHPTEKPSDSNISSNLKRPGANRKGQTVSRSIVDRRGFLGLNNVAYKYSKEDERRLHRYGASVHGSRVAFRMLNDLGPTTDENVPQNKSCASAIYNQSSTDLDSLRKELEQVESHLKKLRGSSKVWEAGALLQKLVHSLSS